MAAATLDHATLSRLAEAGLIRSAQLVGQAGGWALAVKFGVAERFLASRRNGGPRLFRRLETAVEYLRGLGVVRFEVDAAGYARAPTEPSRRRPDRAAALRKA